MTFKFSLLALAAGTALLLATGCSKSASPTTEPDPATKAPAPEATPKKVTEAPAETNRQPAISAKLEPAIVSNNIAPTPAVAPASVPAVVAPPKPATDVPPAPSAALAAPTGTQPTAAPSTSSSPSQLSLAQAATNQIKALAAAATNQFRGLAAAATNQVAAALAITNQGALAATTNQIPALLEKAKVLTANQKYQDALDTLAQLYNTKLTPEQQQKAEDLKNQIQAGLIQKAQSEAGSALGGFLGGKK